MLCKFLLAESGASSIQTLRRAALSTLPLLALLAVGDAAAQQPPPDPGAQPPPGGQPAPGQPGPFAPQPPPGGQPGPFGPQPPPGGGPPPGGPPPGGQPGFGADASFGAQAGFGAEGAQAGAGADVATPDAKLEEEERDYSLIEQPNIYGSTGFLRTAYAGSGAPGTFRVSFLMDWFSTSGFLCDPEDSTLSGGGIRGQRITCGDGGSDDPEDSASHVGAFFTLNATPVKFLEAYASIRTYANSNDQGSPPLLQVLGDTTFGVKLFSPNPGKLFHFGGEIQLMLLNGTGDVGIAGGGTSAAFRGLASFDFRKPGGKGFPLRINTNLGYKLDNSANVVEDVELARGERVGLPSGERLPISRIERFGLGINRVDFFQMQLGAGIMWSKVQPFLEYTLDLPINRQGWTCHTGRVSQGDVCLGLEDFSSSTNASPEGDGGVGYAAVPSRLTLGLRASPFTKSFRGLSGTAAFDIGLSATSTFIEEVAPQAPWTLYIGIGYAFDTKEKEAPPAPPAPPAPAPSVVSAPQNFIRGFVHEQGKDTPVSEAIVTVQGPGSHGPLATGPDGRFITRNLDPGSYTFSIKAAGYKPGTCSGNVGLGPAPAGPAPGAPGAPGQPPPGQPAPGQPGFGPQPQPQPGPGGALNQPSPASLGMMGGQFGPQPQQPPPGQPGPFGPQPQPQQPPPGQPGPFGPQPGQPPAGPPPGGQPPPTTPQGPTYVDIDCPLEALPKLGGITGTVKDAETGAAVAGAVVRMTDPAGKDTSATSDGNGTFSFKDVQPGNVKFKVEAQGYMVHANETDVRANEEARPALSVNKRPKVALVKIQGNEIKISKQIHFETDSAKILGDSNQLMEEIADTMQRNQNLKKVEVQGHTDNTGTREHNQTLSQQRADAVVKWLATAGVDGGRLVSKGYGQDRPLAPNVTAANRAKNRRVQFIILEK